MVESAPKAHRGVNAALGCCGALLGMLLGSATGTVLATLMSPESLDVWGWRIPFIFGLFIGLAGIFLRRHSEPARKPNEEKKNPLLETVKNHRTVIVQLAGLAAFNAVSFYLLFVYIVSWLELVDKISPEKSLFINTLSMIALIPIQLIAASISDRIGRKPVLITASIAAILFRSLFLAGCIITVR